MRNFERKPSDAPVPSEILYLDWANQDPVVLVAEDLALQDWYDMVKPWGGGPAFGSYPDLLLALRLGYGLTSEAEARDAADLLRVSQPERDWAKQEVRHE